MKKNCFEDVVSLEVLIISPCCSLISTWNSMSKEKTMIHNLEVTFSSYPSFIMEILLLLQEWILENGEQKVIC